MNARSIHHRTSRLALAVLLAVAGLLLAAPNAQAKPSGDGPGNAPNAKECHKGGWEELQGTDGTQFANEEDCVAHAAHGGELEPKQTLQDLWEDACVDGGGQVITQNAALQWQCGPAGTQPLSEETLDTLTPICTEANGITATRRINDQLRLIVCNF